MDIDIDWDASDLGDITEHVSILKLDRSKPTVVHLNNQDIKLIVYDWDISLLVSDDIKGYLGLQMINYHTCTISGTKYLISQENIVSPDILFKKYRDIRNIIYKDSTNIELKKCLCFQWMVCLHDISEERLLVRKLDDGSFTLVSFNERHFQDMRNNFATGVMGRYFGRHDNVYRVLYNMVKDKENILEDINNIFDKHGLGSTYLCMRVLENIRTVLRDKAKHEFLNTIY